MPASTPRHADARAAERWSLADGDAIVPGLFAIDGLGGGWDFEAYLAWDERLYSLVVVKVVRPHLVDDETTLRHLAREARLLEGLAHPVIVRGFGAVVDGPRPHIVMEHLEGPTLAETIQEFGSLDIEQLLPLAFQLASALQYLANREVVHLDVKPENVILGVPPRMIDLSVARSIDEASRVTGQIGTDAYMAPEQCDPALAPIGTAADVWGLGATMHHALGGAPPFPPGHGDELSARFPQLEASPGRLPAHAPPMLEDLILDCLEYEPAKRPSPADVALRLEPMVAQIKRGRILGRGRPKIR